MSDVETLARKLFPDGPVHISPLTGGVSAKVHLLESGAVRYVVREPPSHANGEPRSAAEEFALLEHLHATGLPVPAPILFDAPFIVMEHVDGSTDLPDDAVEKMAGCLAALHAVDVQELPPLPRREDPVVGVLEYLPDLTISSHVRDVLTARGALVPRNPDTLLHGDFWPANVIWRDDEIAAVIDWEDAAVGDPMCDIAGARLELMWAVDQAAADQFLAAYLRAHPTDTTDLPFWEMFVSAAALKFMHVWGLPEADEAARRRGAVAFFERAASAALG